MNELLSAAEKRRRYESAMDDATKKELAIVTEIINNATGTYIRFDKMLCEPVAGILKEKGYKCGYVQTGMNENEYRVSW